MMMRNGNGLAVGGSDVGRVVLVFVVEVADIIVRERSSCIAWVILVRETGTVGVAVCIVIVRESCAMAWEIIIICGGCWEVVRVLVIPILVSKIVVIVVAVVVSAVVEATVTRTVSISTAVTAITIISRMDVSLLHGIIDVVIIHDGLVRIGDERRTRRGERGHGRRGPGGRGHLKFVLFHLLGSFCFYLFQMA